MSTAIEWTDETWNPVTGCTKVSPGCDNCYAERVTERWSGPGSFEKVVLHPDRLDKPLHWRKPRKVFVNSMSDLFHEDIPNEFIARVFAVMAQAERHTFQVLTKRHGRMRSLLSRSDFEPWVREIAREMKYGYGQSNPLMNDQNYETWPLPNVWLGVSVEDQHWADIRIPALLDTPAAVRFLSCEPLLGEIDLGLRVDHRGHQSDNVNGWPHPAVCLTCSTEDLEVEWTIPYGEDGRPIPKGANPNGIGWVICGGESGTGARPMHPAWARDLRDQCVQAGVPFLFKQWGEWAPGSHDTGSRGGMVGRGWYPYPGAPRETYAQVSRIGKKRAGRELDGREWDEYPGLSPDAMRVLP